jgi:heme A synthase
MSNRQAVGWATLGALLLTVIQALVGFGTTVGQGQPRAWDEVADWT